MLTHIKQFFQSPSALQQYRGAHRLWQKILADTVPQDTLSLSAAAQKHIAGLKIQTVEALQENGIKIAAGGFDPTQQIAYIGKDFANAAHEMVHAAQHQCAGFLVRSRHWCMRFLPTSISKWFFPHYTKARAAYQEVYKLCTQQKDPEKLVESIQAYFKTLPSKTLKQLKKEFFQEIQAYQLGTKNHQTLGRLNNTTDKTLTEHHRNLNRMIRRELRKRSHNH